MAITTEAMAADIGLLRLLQLVSPGLPIGAFAYSQGLETAIELKWLANRHEVLSWLRGLVLDCLAELDVPVFFRLYQAWGDGNGKQIEFWNAFILASRAASETHAEDARLGKALLRILATLGVAPDTQLQPQGPVAYMTAFALACVQWQIHMTTAASAYLFAWAESQVSAAVRLVPLGQSDGQSILAELALAVPEAVARAASVADENIGAGAPAHGIACALHETQYSRLFRS